MRTTIGRRSFAVVSSFSSAGHGHAAGIAYAFDGAHLWFHTMRSSRKARNVASNPNVGICVTVRKLPVGPPFTISFQGEATVVSMEDELVLDRLGAGTLKAITSHGELETSDGCFVRVTPTGPRFTYGLGVSALALLRDPLGAGPGVVSFDAWEATR